jgi:transposase
VGDLLALAMDKGETGLPVLARQALHELAAALEGLDRRIERAEAAILAWHKDCEASRRLAAIPGIGPITASAIVATVGDARQFGSARHFAAWLGLVPKQNSSGGKQRQGGISKQGDRYLRRLLVVGATAVIRLARGGMATAPSAIWAHALLERRPIRLVTVALANKTARIAWALLSRGEAYRKTPLLQAV